VSRTTHRPIVPRRHIIKNENKPTQLAESDFSSSGAASRGPAISGVVVLLSVGKGRTYPPSPAIIFGGNLVSAGGNFVGTALTVGANGSSSPADFGLTTTGLALTD